MKKTIPPLLLLLMMSSVCLAQKDNDTYTDVHYVEKNADLFSNEVKLGTKDDLYSAIIKLMKYGAAAGTIKTDQVDFYSKEKNWVIIVVHNNMKWENGTFKTDLKKLTMVTLHYERKKWSSKRDWSEYALNTRNVMLVLLGRTGLAEDESPVDLSIDIKNNDSFSKTSFQDLVKVLKDSFRQSSSPTDVSYGKLDGLPVRFVTLRKDKIKPPSKISYSAAYVKEITTADSLNPIHVTVNNVDVTKSDVKKTLEDNFKQPAVSGNVTFNIPNVSINYKAASRKMTLDIHERNFFAFSIGISGAQFNVRDFTLDSVRNIAISKLDSTHQKEWKSNLNVNIEFYPFGRDIDRLEPWIKDPFYRLHTRFGLFGGIRLSDDPLAAVNAGFTFSYSKTVTLTFGWSWLNNRVADDQQVKIGNITNLDQAKEFFRRRYERSNFTVGITFAPVQIAKALGIGEKKKDKE